MKYHQIYRKLEIFSIFWDICRATLHKMKKSSQCINIKKKFFSYKVKILLCPDQRALKLYFSQTFDLTIQINI